MCSIHCTTCCRGITTRSVPQRCAPDDRRPDDHQSASTIYTARPRPSLLCGINRDGKGAMASDAPSGRRTWAVRSGGKSAWREPSRALRSLLPRCDSQHGVQSRKTSPVLLTKPPLERSELQTMLLGELLLLQRAGAVQGNPFRSFFCVEMALTLPDDNFPIATASHRPSASSRCTLLDDCA